MPIDAEILNILEKDLILRVLRDRVVILNEAVRWANLKLRGDVRSQKLAALEAERVMAENLIARIRKGNLTVLTQTEKPIAEAAGELIAKFHASKRKKHLDASP